MKIRLEIVLVGLAISFALPTFAQEKDAAVDPQIVQQLHAEKPRAVVQRLQDTELRAISQVAE